MISAALSRLGTRHFGLKFLKRGATSMQTHEQVNPVKPFEDIPEVRGLPLIGTLLDYTVLKGFDIDYSHKLWIKRHKQYGDIFKERSPISGKYSVFCCSPDDTELMFRYESKTAFNDGMSGFSYIRNKLGMRDTFFNYQGEHWYKQRRILNQTLLVNKWVWKYTALQHELTKEFMKLIEQNLDENGEVPNFMKELKKWAFESTGVFVVNRQRESWTTRQDTMTSDVIKWNEEVMNFMAISLRGLSLLDYYETKEFKVATVAMKNLTEATKILVHEGLKARKEFAGNSVLETIMNAEELSEEEKILLVVDLLLTGVELTAHSSALMLYCAARNPEAQEKLRLEIIDTTNASSGNITGRDLNNMEYMNAFIKEVTRLYPLSFNQTRTYDRDVVMSNYRIPSGTSIENTSNILQNKNPKYFPQPELFMPERWIDGNATDNKFVSTGPFGFGARACPGRRFAMQELRLMLVEVFQKYVVEYHHKPMETKLNVTGSPSEEPQFKFVPL